MASMNEIAGKAGVSRSTVSLILNGRQDALRISTQTCRRVLAVAEQLGYRRNRLAQAVVTGKSQVLGFLCASPEAESSARILAGALDEAQASGFFLKVLRLHNDIERDAVTLEECLEMRVMGLLVVYFHHAGFARYRAGLKGLRLPLVIADDMDRQASGGTQVLSDYRMGMAQAVEHLHQLGHRHIALLTGLPAGQLPAREREQAFRAAMRRHHLPVPADFVVTQFGEAAVVEASASRLLASRRRPTAIVGGTDMAALLGLRAARALGLSVPQDLSVVGMGNAQIAEWTDPPMTIVEQPFYGIGRAAVKHLLARFPNEETAWSDSASREHLPTRLTVRGTTSALIPSSVTKLESPRTSP